MIDSYYLSFPVLQIALFMAVATAALPYLARGLQRIIEVFIALVALAWAVGGHGLPLNVLGSLAIGWGGGRGPARLRLTARPAVRADVRLLLASSASARAACARCHGRSGAWPSTRPPRPARGGRRLSRLGVSVYGRDAADARLLTKAGRFLLYRDSGPSLTVTRLQQVEHEAFLTLRAAQAGVAVPEIVEAGTAGPSRDALLVCRLPPGRALAEADAADAQRRHPR